MLCVQVLRLLPVSILEVPRKCQRSSSPVLSTAEILLILFCSWFHCELVPFETTALWTSQLTLLQPSFSRSVVLFFKKGSEDVYAEKLLVVRWPLYAELQNFKPGTFEERRKELLVIKCQVKPFRLSDNG